MILGIDPGLGGAIAFYWPEDNNCEIYDTPTHTVTVNGSKKRVIDLYQYAELIHQRAHHVHLAVIEDVHAMPKQGVTSSFTFGFVAGAAQAICAAYRVPVHLVKPAAWKRQLGLTADKDSSRRKASQMFPQHAGLWPNKGHDGRAEALLLAWYGGKLA